MMSDFWTDTNKHIDNLWCSDEVEQKIREDERAKIKADIMAFINTSNRGTCDYFIIDQIEKYLKEEQKE